MAVRQAALATLALSAVLAGCLGGEDDPLAARPGLPERGSAGKAAPPPRYDPVAARPDLPQPRSGWALDCFLPADADWPQDCVVRASRSPRTKAEMWVGINPTDSQNVVVAAKDLNPESSMECVWNGLFVTHDGGGNWTEVTIGGKYVDRTPQSPFFGYHCNTDPMFRFADDGTLHFGVEVYNAGGVGDTLYDYQGDLATVTFKVLLATSHDGGLTWPQVITWQPDLVTLTDYSRMAVSPATGTVFEAINHLGPGLVCHLLSSRDGGGTAAPVVVVTPDQAPGASLCRGIAVSPDGTVVIAFKNALLPGSESGRDDVIFVRSTDDGLTFSASNLGWTSAPIPDPMEGTEASSRAGQQLELAYDLTDGPGRGTLWAITAEAPDGQADVFVRQSPDDGATWSDPVRIHPESPAHQYMANLAVADDGSLHAFYYDRQYDAEGRLIGITHSWSLDAGATWQSEPVTTVPWDGDLGRHQAGYPWIGDYIGVDAVGLDVWAGFPDASLGAEPVAAAAHVRLLG